jgi:hypothetical protein
MRLGSTLPSPLGETMPRKGYKRALGRSAGMPEVMTAQNFNRRISAEEALILATAGDGSKTEGFRNLLSLYGELHNIGYRCCMSLQEFLDIKIKMSGTKIN